MTTRPSRLLLAAVVAGVVALPASASAARWAGGDPTGDAGGSTHTTEPPPCGTDTDTDVSAVPNVDLTRLVVRHQRPDVTITVALADVVAGELHLEIPMLVPGSDYALLVDRSPGGHVQRDLIQGYESGIEAASHHADRCGGFAYAYAGGGCGGLHVSVSEERDTVTAVIPRGCLGNPSWVRAGASTHAVTEQAGGAHTYASDRWGRRGPGAAYTPTYGPRVRPPARPSAHRAGRS